MPEDGLDLRRISWIEAFPFIRLFRTFRLSIHMSRLALGLAGILVCYVGGRVLDAVWPAAGRVAVVSAEGHNEIHLYAAGPPAGSPRAAPNREELDARWRQQAALAVLQWAGVSSRKDAEQALTTQPARDLIEAAQERERLRSDLLTLIEAREAAGLLALDAKADLTDADRARRGEQLRQAADYLRLTLSGIGAERFSTSEVRTRAGELISAADASIGRSEQARDQSDLRQALERFKAIAELESRAPRGVFISLFNFERDCFAGMVQGTLSGRFSFAGGALSAEPSLLGSVASGLRGGLWAVTQRPWFALCYGTLVLVVFAYFGGAICRSAALESARDEVASIGSVLAFAREKFPGFVLAPLFPLGIVAFCGVVLLLGGLVGSIPWLGELFAGALYFLALLLGFVAALAVIALLLGFHLMWPAIAVEGSEAFDAVSRAFGFVSQRIWSVVFQAVVLLAFGGVAFVVVRAIAVVLLKLTHAFTGAGMSVFGAVESSAMSTVDKLDALWHMPAWGELALLPGAGGAPLWGTFHNAPLNGPETLAMWGIMVWVFLTVGLLGAFVVSFYFCGATESYYLLRREIDAIDWDEVYYEGDDLAPGVSEPPISADQAATPETPAAGTDSPGPSENRPED